MKAKHVIFPLVALLIALSGVSGTWGVAYADEPNASANFNLTYQQAEEVFLGKGGVFMPSSNYTAVATINRWNPYGIDRQGLRFIERWIEFRIYDANTEPFNLLWGVNYVYFTLEVRQRRMWEAGELSIYYYNESTRNWDECPTWLVAHKNAPHGRLTCVMPNFGYYGLAIKK
jgi:hypothetical protein